MNPPDLQQALLDSFSKEATANTQRYEQAAIGEIIRAMASASPTLDSYVNWCLAGTGATTALLAGNLDKVETLLGSGLTTALFASLVLSILCGSASKFLSIRLQVETAVTKHIAAAIGPLSDEFHKKRRALMQEASGAGIQLPNTVDPDRFKTAVVEVFPAFYRGFVRRQIEAVAEDAMRPHKMMAAQLVWQFLWCVGQVAFITLAVLCIILA